MIHLEVRYLALPDLAMEFRATENGLGRVSGVLLRYGDVAALPSFDGTKREETFAFGAMKPYDGPIVANVLHDRNRLLAAHPGNMDLTFGSYDVRVAFDLPDTTDGREAGTLIRAGVLSALSAEFSVEDDSWAGGRRTVRAATLYGLGLVAQPAYPASQLDRASLAHADNLTAPDPKAAYRRNLLKGLL